jgi:predicted nucleic acid-binding protein
VFADAEAGEAVVQAPSTALAETLYAVSRDKDVRGVSLSGTAEQAREALVGSGPISVAPVDETALTEYAQLVAEFSIHDGLVVASHRAEGTEGILTSDGVIADAGYDTYWE